MTADGLGRGLHIPNRETFPQLAELLTEAPFLGVGNDFRFCRFNRHYAFADGGAAEIGKEYWVPGAGLRQCQSPYFLRNPSGVIGRTLPKTGRSGKGRSWRPRHQPTPA